MPFKFNISHKGKTIKKEAENESLIGKRIGETIQGNEVSADLAGYEIEITGTSDEAGFPGKKGLEGASYHKELLTHGFGMKNTKKGLRLRKTLRGEEISLKTSQINTKVIKEGNKKFEELLPKKEKEEAEVESAPAKTQTIDSPSEKPITDTKKPKETSNSDKKQEVKEEPKETSDADKKEKNKQQ